VLLYCAPGNCLGFNEFISHFTPNLLSIFIIKILQYSFSLGHLCFPCFPAHRSPQNVCLMKGNDSEEAQAALPPPISLPCLSDLALTRQINSVQVSADRECVRSCACNFYARLVFFVFKKHTLLYSGPGSFDGRNERLNSGPTL